MKKIGALVIFGVVVAIAAVWIYNYQKAKKEFQEACAVGRVRYLTKSQLVQIAKEAPVKAANKLESSVQKFKVGSLTFAVPAATYSPHQYNSKTTCIFNAQDKKGIYLSYEILAYEDKNGKQDAFNLIYDLHRKHPIQLTCEYTSEQQKLLSEITIFETLLSDRNSSVVYLDQVLPRDITYLVQAQSSGKSSYMYEWRHPVKDGKYIGIYRVTVGSKELRDAIFSGSLDKEKSVQTVAPQFEKCIEDLIAQY